MEDFQVIPMRSQAGIAPEIVQLMPLRQLFPIEGLPGSRPGIFLQDGFSPALFLDIRKRQCSLGTGNAVIDLLGRCPDPFQRPETEIQDSPCRPGQCLIPDSQLSFLQFLPFPALFQETVPLLEYSIVLGQEIIIDGTDLGDLHIQEFPAQSRISFDQLQIVRGKEDQVHPAILFPGAHRIPIQEILFFQPSPFLVPFHQETAGSISVSILQFCGPFFLPEAGDFFFMPSPEGKAPGRQIDTFQQVGLPLGIISIKNSYIMSQWDGHLLVIPEMEEPEVFQAHQKMTRTGVRIYV